MSVVTIKKARTTTPASTLALMEQVQKKTETLLDAADRVLVVYEPSGSAKIYCEGGVKRAN